ncbi:hypothetical protein CRE_18848 [Caenorhabditis remanei]|uniref:Uncharacterized protein n=1 Tax=Caenorhabditis remanei TaxID=31234 RepID=E3LKZ7_CAERE|nr:hypothetical protein CRE_18848 [Caenorhabditis remanei]
MKFSTQLILCLLLCILFVTVESSLPDWWHLRSPFPKDFDEWSDSRPYHGRVIRPMRVTNE